MIMLKKLLYRIKDIKSGNRRTKNLMLQSALSLIFKIISQVIVFILVPVQLAILGKQQYGVWVTLFSITSWISFADLGIGSGLINKLNIAISRGNKDDARKYVSSAYICIGGIAILMIIGLFVLVPFIDLKSVFNCNFLSEIKLHFTVVFVFIAIIAGFVFQLSNSVLKAFQKNSFTLLVPIFTNVLFIIILYTLNMFHFADILYVAVSYFFSCIFIWLCVNVIVFKKYDYLLPSFTFFDRSCIKDMLSLSILFFVANISKVVIFSTDNILITQLFGPTAVTSYSIVVKIFFAITMIMSMVTLPLWPAYTEAYEKGDLPWIKKKMALHLVLVILFLIFVILLTFNIDFIVKLWIGSEVEIPLLLKLFGVLYVLLLSLHQVFALVLYAISKIKLTTICSVIAALINIPASIYFAKYLGLGTSGVLLGTLVAFFVVFMVEPFLVYYHLFKNRIKPESVS